LLFETSLIPITDLTTISDDMFTDKSESAHGL